MIASLRQHTLEVTTHTLETYALSACPEPALLPSPRSGSAGAAPTQQEMRQRKQSVIDMINVERATLRERIERPPSMRRQPRPSGGEDKRVRSSAVGNKIK